MVATAASFGASLNVKVMSSNSTFLLTLTCSHACGSCHDRKDPVIQRQSIFFVYLDVQVLLKDEPTLRSPTGLSSPHFEAFEWLYDHHHVDFWNQKDILRGAGLTKEPMAEGIRNTHLHLAENWTGNKFRKDQNYKPKTLKTSWLLSKCTQHLGNPSAYWAALCTVNDCATYSICYHSSPTVCFTDCIHRIA